MPFELVTCFKLHASPHLTEMMWSCERRNSSLSHRGTVTVNNHIFVGRGSRTRTLPIRIGQRCLLLLCEPKDYRQYTFGAVSLLPHKQLRFSFSPCWEICKQVARWLSLSLYFFVFFVLPVCFWWIKDLYKKDQVIPHSSGAEQSSVAQSYSRYITIGMVWCSGNVEVFQFRNSNDNLPSCTVCAETDRKCKLYKLSKLYKIQPWPTEKHDST